ncbi:retropepsin-like aspartic protease [Paraglaciecola sp.]|uniref:retropepsin-like aspartic protease n=1 Tax=Paraglaciecola sp. TaxID=1920173 RepID=UPI0032667F16
MNNFFSIILVASISLSIASCGVINKVRLMNENNDLQTIWNEDDTQANPKADFVYAKPYIYGSIDGVNELKFLIDTGSSISMLFDTQKVKRINLKPGYELIVGGYGGHEYSAAYQTEVNKLSIDSLSFKSVDFGYIPVSETGFFIRPDQVGFDGVIGNDILRDLVWHIDRDSNKVTVHKTLPASLLKKSIVWTPFDTFFGKISFKAKITFEDHILERDIILDTGSRYHMSINDAYFHDNDEKAFPSPSVQSAGYSLSGLATHHKANTPSVEVESLKFMNVVTNIIQEDEDDFWTLGSALLSQYEIIVDYPNMQLGFIAREGQSFKSQYNLVGLELRKLQNGNFIVGYSSPDLPSSSLGFEVGSEINLINGVNAQDISVDQWLELASKEGVFQFCLVNTDTCPEVEVFSIEGFSR